MRSTFNNESKEFKELTVIDDTISDFCKEIKRNSESNEFFYKKEINDIIRNIKYNSYKGYHFYVYSYRDYQYLKEKDLNNIYLDLLKHPEFKGFKIEKRERTTTMRNCKYSIIYISW